MLSRIPLQSTISKPLVVQNDIVNLFISSIQAFICANCFCLKDIGKYISSAFCVHERYVSSFNARTCSKRRHFMFQEVLSRHMETLSWLRLCCKSPAIISDLLFFVVIGREIKIYAEIQSISPVGNKKTSSTNRNKIYNASMSTMRRHNLHTRISNVCSQCLNLFSKTL